jgi:tetratricopeptide (TPR) repeat protein
MTAENKKRIVLYSVTLLLMAALAYAGFVYRADPDVDTLVGSAEVLAQTGVYDKAIENARLALEQEPENRYAHIIMAHCLDQVGNHDEAVEHYRIAVKLSDPKDPQTDSLRLYLGEILIRAGHPDESAELAGKILETGENRNARFVLAAARIAQKRFDDAAEQYLRCEELAPEDPDPLILHAEMLEGQGRFEGALAKLDRAAEIEPVSPEVQLPRARILASLGRQEAAVETLLKVAETQAVRMQRFLFTEEALESLRSDERLLAACVRPLEK